MHAQVQLWRRGGGPAGHALLAFCLCYQPRFSGTFCCRKHCLVVKTLCLYPRLLPVSDQIYAAVPHDIYSYAYIKSLLVLCDIYLVRVFSLTPAHGSQTCRRSIDQALWKTVIAPTRSTKPTRSAVERRTADTGRWRPACSWSGRQASRCHTESGSRTQPGSSHVTDR